MNNRASWPGPDPAIHVPIKPETEGRKAWMPVSSAGMTELGELSKEAPGHAYYPTAVLRSITLSSCAVVDRSCALILPAGMGSAAVEP